MRTARLPVKTDIGDSHGRLAPRDEVAPLSRGESQDGLYLA